MGVVGGSGTNECICNDWFNSVDGYYFAANELRGKQYVVCGGSFRDGLKILMLY